MLSEARQEATDRAGCCLLSSPSTYPQFGVLVAAAMGLRRGRPGPNLRSSPSNPCQGNHLQTTPVWSTPGKLEEVRSHQKGTVEAEA